MTINLPQLTEKQHMQLFMLQLCVLLPIVIASGIAIFLHKREKKIQ